MEPKRNLKPNSRKFILKLVYANLFLVLLFLILEREIEKPWKLILTVTIFYLLSTYPKYSGDRTSLLITTSNSMFSFLLDILFPSNERKVAKNDKKVLIEETSEKKNINQNEEEKKKRDEEEKKNFYDYEVKPIFTKGWETVSAIEKITNDAKSEYTKILPGNVVLENSNLHLLDKNLNSIRIRFNKFSNNAETLYETAAEIIKILNNFKETNKNMYLITSRYFTYRCLHKCLLQAGLKYYEVSAFYIICLMKLVNIYHSEIENLFLFEITKAFPFIIDCNVPPQNKTASKAQLGYLDNESHENYANRLKSYTQVFYMTCLIQVKNGVQDIAAQKNSKEFGSKLLDLLKNSPSKDLSDIFWKSLSYFHLSPSKLNICTASILQAAIESAPFLDEADRPQFVELLRELSQKIIPLIKSFNHFENPTQQQKLIKSQVILLEKWSTFQNGVLRDFNKIFKKNIGSDVQVDDIDSDEE